MSDENLTPVEYFRARYGFRESDVQLVPYGSRVYGTHKEESDWDYIGIIPAKRFTDTGTEFRYGELNVHMINEHDFQRQLNLHKIHCLEAYFLPEAKLTNKFKFTLDLPLLRTSLSEKASHSFVKAKKKIDKEHDYYVGWKSLFHSLRILKFAIQIASKGKIVDYAEANPIWFEIRDAQRYTWDYFKEKYQPVYNELASEFKKLAPKE